MINFFFEECEPLTDDGLFHLVQIRPVFREDLADLLDAVRLDAVTLPVDVIALLERRVKLGRKAAPVAAGA
jgi:hypothetical protein